MFFTNIYCFNKNQGATVPLGEKCPSTEFFLVRIQSESRKIRTRKNSVFGHFSRTVQYVIFFKTFPTAKIKVLKETFRTFSLNIYLRTFLRKQLMPSKFISGKTVTGRFRSSRPEVLYEKGVLRYFAKFSGKHLRHSLFCKKVADLRPATSLKRGSGTGVFL